MRKITILVMAIMAISSIAAQTPVYLDPSQPIEARVQDALSRMTTHEKVRLCHGQSKMSSAGVPRLGIRQLNYDDGPHGVREELEWNSWNPARWTNDYVVAFPSLTCLAATWNPSLASVYGNAVSEEFAFRGKDVMLGPGVNIARTPLNGRNFEYMGEDPCLAGTMAVPYVQAAQGNGVACCLKHFALNNQEINRFGVNVNVDERTLNEIYLPAFKTVVQKAEVWTVMGSYPFWQGVHCCENDSLVNGILKRGWGFDGILVSDWGGTTDTWQAAMGGMDVEMATGTDGKVKEGTFGYDDYYLANPFEKLVNEGKIPMSVLDDKAARVLRTIFRTSMNPGKAIGSQCSEAHYAACRAIGEEGVVLLKNDGILPLVGASLKNKEERRKNKLGDGRQEIGDGQMPVLSGDGRQETGDGQMSAQSNVSLQSPVSKKVMSVSGLQSPVSKKVMSVSSLQESNHKAQSSKLKAQRILVVGENATRSLTQGGGSSELKTLRDISPLEGLRKAFGDGVDYAQGYSSGRAMYDHVDTVDPAVNDSLRSEALEKAKKADLIIFIGGLNKNCRQDCENSDREGYSLPFGQDALISDLAAVQRNIVVCTFGGNAFATPWIDDVKAFVHCWYLGSMAGETLAEVLSGEINPSGKLPVTFAKRLDDYAYTQYGQEAYPGVDNQVYYKEGIYVGYRHFDTHKVRPQFPFGFGLSYTTFKYGKPVVSYSTLTDGGSITVSVDITNTGNRAGKETVQLYIGQRHPSVPRPAKELKGFEKVSLSPGETKTVTFSITKDMLAYYSETAHDWAVDNDDYTAYICSSSTDVRGKVVFKKQ